MHFFVFIQVYEFFTWNHSVLYFLWNNQAAWYPPQNLPEHLPELAKGDIERTVTGKDFSVILYYSPT